MTKYRVPKWLLSIIVASVFAGAAYAADAGKTYVMRMGNITSNDAQERMGQKFLDLVEENSGGRITGKLYSGASLGSNDEVMRGLQFGSVQANINPTGYLNQFVPAAGVLTLPWVFPGKTPEEQIRNVTRVMRGEAGQRIKKLAAERGFHIVSFFGIGPNQIYLRQKADGIDDLKDKRIRTIGGQEHTQTVNDWGARAIHMSLPEVYTAIQQGVLDGFDLPADVTVRLKYHEQAPNVLMTNHVVLTQYIAVSKKWYDQLPDELKKAIDEAGRAVEDLGTKEYVESQTASLQVLKKSPKINVVELTDEEIERLQQLNKQGVWQAVATNKAKKELLELLSKDVANLAK